MKEGDPPEDNVTDAMRRMGMQYTESVFYRYAVQVGYRGRSAEDKARELDTLYKKRGYQALPQTVHFFVLDVLEGR
jgi:hypothetical protein